MALIKCPECGRDVSDKASSCPGCGYPLIDQVKEKAICPFCETENESDEDYCESCGMRLTPYKNETNTIHQGNVSDDYSCIFKSNFFDNIYPLKIDKVNRLFKIGAFGRVHPFSDILDVQIYENGGALSKTKAGSMLGRAAIGSLFNPLGAAVGAVTAKKKYVDVVNSIEVIITVNDMQKPIITIPVSIPKGTRKDSMKYRTAIEQARKIEARIKTYMVL